MFNPQRKSKVADIFMEERTFQIHLDKVKAIRHSASLGKQRLRDEQQQLHYLDKIHLSKQEVQNRLKKDLNH